MNYQYHFLEAAQLEYEEAVEWYSFQRRTPTLCLLCYKTPNLITIKIIITNYAIVFNH